MYCAGVPLVAASCPAITPPPLSLVSAMLSMLEAAVTTAALRASPHARRPSRVTPRAFTVELPFTNRPVGSVEFTYQLMLGINRSHDAVLTPGYLRKSYQLASAITRVAEKPLTCSETHCERRMPK
jgi:hypothetical protein